MYTFVYRFLFVLPLIACPPMKFVYSITNLYKHISEFSLMLQHMSELFQTWKYKDSIFFLKALLISRDSALEKVVKNTEKEDIINIPIPYNPRLPDYGYIIKQN